MQRQKKNKDIVETLQAYISPTNKAWLKTQAKELGPHMSVSAYLDALITLARKGVTPRP